MRSNPPCGIRTPSIVARDRPAAVKGDRERCLASGMDGYLSKPLRGQELARAIDDLVPPSPATGPPGVFVDKLAGPVLDRDRALERLGGTTSSSRN